LRQNKLWKSRKPVETGFIHERTRETKSIHPLAALKFANKKTILSSSGVIPSRRHVPKLQWCARAPFLAAHVKRRIAMMVWLVGSCGSRRAIPVLSGRILRRG